MWSYDKQVKVVIWAVTLGTIKTVFTKPLNQKQTINVGKTGNDAGNVIKMHM